MGGLRLRLNEVGHGLGLRQVEFAVEEGALRELAWLGKPAASLHQQFHDALLDVERAVAGYLHHILARVGTGGGVLGDHHLVEQGVPIK